MRSASIILACCLLAACATKWTGAPSSVYPGPNFDTEVSWIAAGENQYDLAATPKNILTMCCNIPADEVRMAIVNGARTKSAELCATRKAAVDSDHYDPRYYSYSARIICR